MIRPPPLEPGSWVRVVAPSSPFDRTLVRRGLAWLGSRYRVRFSPGLFARSGYLAGEDARRTQELNEALADREAGAIVAARGGYGLGRITPELDLEPLLRSPKWLVGFSDLTALHLELSRAGMMSLHAHNVAGLGRGDAGARAAWCRALEQPEAPIVLEGLTSLHAGTASGRLCGGNLTVLFAAQAAGRFRLPPGAILLLEDIGETSYRIDRMLTALLQSRALEGIGGIVLGEFTDCSAGKYQVPTEQVLRERLCGLGVPILADLPVGHGRRNVPLRLGAQAHLDASRGTLQLE